MDIISINSIKLPTPLSGGYSVSLSDLDSENTNRGEDGIMFRERIRAGIYKITYQAQVTTEQLEAIIAAIEADKLSVTFYFGKLVTAEMYAGDKSINLLAKDSVHDSDRWEIGFNLIQF